MPVWTFTVVGLLVLGMTAWSVYGLMKAVRALRGATSSGQRAGLKVTVGILSLRLFLVAAVGGLMVWTVARA